MRKKQQGFTMVELIVVLVLMILLGAAVVPSIQQINKQRLQNVAQTLCLDLTAMRKQARATGEIYELILASGNHGYEIKSTGMKPICDTAKKEDHQMTIIMNGHGSDINELVFEKKVMKDSAVGGTELEVCTIKIQYGDLKEYAQITFDNQTGHYTLEMKV